MEATALEAGFHTFPQTAKTETVCREGAACMADHGRKKSNKVDTYLDLGPMGITI